MSRLSTLVGAAADDRRPAPELLAVACADGPATAAALARRRRPATAIAIAGHAAASAVVRAAEHARASDLERGSVAGAWARDTDLVVDDGRASGPTGPCYGARWAQPIVLATPAGLFVADGDDPAVHRLADPSALSGAAPRLVLDGASVTKLEAPGRAATVGEAILEAALAAATAGAVAGALENGVSDGGGALLADAAGAATAALAAAEAGLVDAAVLTAGAAARALLGVAAETGVHADLAVVGALIALLDLPRIRRRPLALPPTEELADAVDAEPVSTPESRAGDPAPAPAPTTAAEVMRTLPDRFRPERAGEGEARFHFRLKGADIQEWTVEVGAGSCRVREGLHGEPDCVVRARESTFVGIQTGATNPQAAFMTGRVKVSNLTVMTRFLKAFRRIEASDG